VRHRGLGPPISRLLLRKTPDNLKYHKGLMEAMGLSASEQGWTPEQVSRLTELYAELAKESPQSIAVRRIPLDFLVRRFLCPRGLQKAF
jgi:NMDA receptor-regulated protein 1